MDSRNDQGNDHGNDNGNDNDNGKLALFMAVTTKSIYFLTSNLKMSDKTRVTNDVINDNDLEKLLRSDEHLDRSSPELWPEKIPGITKFLAKSSTPLPQQSIANEWIHLNDSDLNLLHHFGSLTTSALLEKVKDLQNMSYQLSLEESREMTRATLLHVFHRSNK